MSQGTCIEDDCEAPAYSRKWCSMHYARWRRTGSPKGLRPRGPEAPRFCDVTDCDEPHRAKGYCDFHYKLWMKTGSTDTPPPKEKRLCSEPGCERDHYGHGYCHLHLSRLQKYGSTADRPRTGPRGPQKNPRKKRPVEERFWEKVDKKGPMPIDSMAKGNCWVWTAGLNKGYGHFIPVKGENPRGAHIMAWEWENGPTPEGMELDHICRRRSCVRPSHLRPVFRVQNTENRDWRSANTKSGIRGVQWIKRLQRWQAQVGSGRKKYVGPVRTTIAEAAADVVELRLKLHTHNDVDRLTPPEDPEPTLPGL